MSDVIQLKNVSAGYNGLLVLEDISFSIGQREFLGIIGPNGGGKTTLLKVMLGLVKPTRGEVLVFGLPPKEGRRKIGYVPQYTRFFQDFPISVWEVALMGRMAGRGIGGRYNREDLMRTEEALEKVSMLEARHRQIGSLSEGQKQRVFIARALATQAEALFLDEPTASVDHPMQTSLYELLGRLSQSMTVVLISHDLGIISRHVHKVACLNKKLYYHGTSEMKAEDIEKAYQCPIDFIGHGHAPHRILKEHEE